MSNTASRKIAVLTPSKGRHRLDLKAIARRLFSGKKKTAAEEAEPKPLIYDAEDIEEANRIGEAICKQHAR